MSSFFGQYLRLGLFGQSHGPAVGVTVDGLPAGMEIDMAALGKALARRAPGQSGLSTARREADEVEFLSGVMEGRTTGQPICAVIRSGDTRSADYGAGVDAPRPSHADYTGHIRYFGFEDWRGGGSFSGRLTAPLVACGALCAQFLQSRGIRIYAHIAQLGGFADEDIDSVEDISRLAALREKRLPTLSEAAGSAMENAILAAKAAGDSVGGVIACRMDGAPAGLGAPFFDSVESVLSHLLFSIPGVKGVSFGAGFDLAAMRGSEANDACVLEEGRIRTATNHAGGVNGGVSNGMPIIVRCAFRPTPSIAQPQRTVSLREMKETELRIQGRHDPCILPRAVPVVEAMCAIGLTELWKERLACLKA